MSDVLFETTLGFFIFLVILAVCCAITFIITLFNDIYNKLRVYKITDKLLLSIAILIFCTFIGHVVNSLFDI